jgi:hypothetical protein
MTDRFRNHQSHLATRALAALGVGAAVIFGTRVLIDFFGFGSAVPYSMPDQNTPARSKCAAGVDRGH